MQGFGLPRGRKRISLPRLPASISFRGVELAFNIARNPPSKRFRGKLAHTVACRPGPPDLQRRTSLGL